MARIRKHDAKALASLYQRHTQLLRSVISRVVHDEQDTEDLLQEVFIQLWDRADRYNWKKGKPLGWMVTLSRRRAIDRVRRRQSYARAEERLRLATEIDSRGIPSRGAENEVGCGDRGEIFRQVLATLPDHQRDAVILSFYQGFSQREIAARTGIPLGTIKTRLELGVRKIRAAILALGGANEWSLNHA
jgi:RNA polymerase sigma-70 factor (ECF subfamily)